MVGFVSLCEVMLMTAGTFGIRYLDRQVAALRQQLEHADKMTRFAEDMQTRQAELLLIIKETYPKYEAVARRIKCAKAEFEAALSAHFEGRRVNLMGDISSI